MSDITNYCKIHGIYLGDYLRFEDEHDEHKTHYAKVNRITKQDCVCGDVSYRSCYIFDVNRLYDYIFNHKLTVVDENEVIRYKNEVQK